MSVKSYFWLSVFCAHSDMEFKLLWKQGDFKAFFWPNMSTSIAQQHLGAARVYHQIH